MLTRIRQTRDQFSPAERRVADWLLSHPFQIADMRLAEVARAAAVSDPTVVRFCRTVGCSGFSDLKLTLARQLATQTDLVHADVERRDDAHTVTRKIISASIYELQRVADSLDSEQVANVAAQLVGARRILFAGVGASAMVAHDAHNKFFRLGLPTAPFTDAPTIAQAGATSNANTVLIGISKTGESTAITQGMARAQALGALGVAITAPGSSLAKQADIALFVDAVEDTATFTPMSSRLAQLAVLDVLQVSTAIAGGSVMQRHLEASKQALQAR
ncbi:MAG: MurR/RpiR family transcriptional regulator [Pseudomonadota bacterium]